MQVAEDHSLVLLPAAPVAACCCRHPCRGASPYNISFQEVLSLYGPNDITDEVIWDITVHLE